MPHASHRLDLLLVPDDPERALDLDALAALFQIWQSAGALQNGAPGPERDRIIEGGFVRMSVDRPGRVALYANQQGGFRVWCPATRQGLAMAFSKAVERWRAGEPRSLRCPACGALHPLEALVLEPPGAFASGALVFADVGTAEIQPDAMRALTDALGPLRMVLRRVA